MTQPFNASQTNPLHGGPSFSFKNRIIRFSWKFVWLVFAAWTPVPFHRWRIFLLNLFGAKVHVNAHVYGSARIWYPPNLVMDSRSCIGPRVNCYCMAPTHLGVGAIVSQDSDLCAGTHDIDDKDFQLIVKPIFIGEGAWVAAGAFIGPGVSIGKFSVIGARSVVFFDTDSYGVYVGNPATKIRQRLVQ